MTGTVTVRKTAHPNRPTSSDSRRRRVISSVLLRQEMTLAAVVVLIGVLTTMRNPDFVSSANITDMVNGSVIYFVMACGTGLLMIGGGLDFSIGSVFALGGVVTAWMLVHGLPVPVAIAIGISVGVIVGTINNFVVSYLHVPPIIATLGTFFILEGITVQITGGSDILPLPQSFQQLGQGELFGVPYPVVYGVVIGIVFWFVLERTRFGVNVRALGGNRDAAVGNGLRVGRLDLAVYVLAAATAAIAGIIYSARIGSGQTEAGGAAVTLQVVTAVLIGGTSLFGGLGTITGVAVGALLLSEIQNALVVAHIEPQYNSIVVGTILILAVAADHLRRKRLYRR